MNKRTPDEPTKINPTQVHINFYHREGNGTLDCGRQLVGDSIGVIDRYQKRLDQKANTVCMFPRQRLMGIRALHRTSLALMGSSFYTVIHHV